ncbi:hypothetical protein ACUTAH_02855 [Metapseudomonas furukawaii]|uniref:hypothetical protein n=1 Tax=Metapseudomonas furukawaii TaxID=1149133 RepID=UPI00404595E2
MKNKLIGGYLVIAVIFGTWGYFFGNNQHRGFFYNLGAGMTWPITIFKGDPELDGASDEEFSLSLRKMAQAHQYEALRIDYAIGIIATLIHAEADESFDGDQIRAMFTPGGKLPENMFANMWQIEGLKEELKDRLDGMDFDDLMSEADDAKEALLELAEERPAPKKPEPVAVETQPIAEETAMEEANAQSTEVPPAGEACYEAKLSSFRAEMGEEAAVRFDMINEWRSDCGLPPSA